MNPYPRTNRFTRAAPAATPAAYNVTNKGSAAIEQGGLGGRVLEFASPAEAFAYAAKAAGENDRIIAFGSFHTVAGVMRALTRRSVRYRSVKEIERETHSSHIGFGYR